MRTLLLIGVLPLCACASKAPAPAGPPVIPADRLCEGSADVPRGERDPACAPKVSHAPVHIVHHLAGCGPGLHGPAEVRLGDQPLLFLKPGEDKKVNLPRGDVALTIVRDGVSEAHPLMLAGEEPLEIELGCDPASFAGGLQPLLLEGPTGACGGDQPVRVRAGGLELEIGRDQVQTLLLPVGNHLLRIAGDERIVELGPGGARVEVAPPCTSSPGGP